MSAGRDCPGGGISGSGAGGDTTCPGAGTSAGADTAAFLASRALRELRSFFLGALKTGTFRFWARSRAKSGLYGVGA